MPFSHQQEHHNSMSRRPKILPRGKYTLQWALVIIAGGFYFKEVALMYIGAFLLVLLFVSFWVCWLNFREVVIKRDMPEEVFANNEFTVYLSIKIKKGEPVFSLSLKDLFLPEKKSSFLIPQVDDEWYKCGQIRMKMAHRGVYNEANCQISSDFPLGFFKVENRLKSEIKLTVYPEPVGIEEELELGKGQDNEAEREYITGSNNLGSFRGLREFKPGDPVKLISWSATARSSSLMVREMEPPEPEKFMIIFHTAKFKNHIPDKKQFEKTLKLLTGLFLSLQESGRNFEFFSSYSNWLPVICHNSSELPTQALALLASAQFGEAENFNNVREILFEVPPDYHPIVVSSTPLEFWLDKLPETNGVVTCIDSKCLMTVGAVFI